MVKKTILILISCLLLSGISIAGESVTWTFEWQHNHPNDSVDYYRIYWRAPSQEFYCHVDDPEDDSDDHLEIGCANVGVGSNPFNFDLWSDPDNPQYIQRTSASVEVPKKELCFTVTAVEIAYNQEFESDFSNEICVVKIRWKIR